MNTHPDHFVMFPGVGPDACPGCALRAQLFGLMAEAQQNPQVFKEAASDVVEAFASELLRMSVTREDVTCTELQRRIQRVLTDQHAADDAALLLRVRSLGLLWLLVGFGAGAISREMMERMHDSREAEQLLKEVFRDHPPHHG